MGIPVTPMSHRRLYRKLRGWSQLERTMIGQISSVAKSCSCLCLSHTFAAPHSSITIHSLASRQTPWTLVNRSSKHSHLIQPQIERNRYRQNGMQLPYSNAKVDDLKIIPSLDRQHTSIAHATKSFQVSKNILIVAQQVLAVDLLNPTPQAEARKYKLKVGLRHRRMTPCPEAK